MTPGIRTRHARSCKSRDGGGCNCIPTYQAQAYDARTGRQVWRTFATRSAAKLWRQDAQVALRRGTMRPPTARTIAEAAEVLIAGAHDGTILDRGGKPYKPSTARGYEQLLRSYVVPALGGWKLSQVQRRDIQDFVDDLRKQGLSASTIANILDPLRVIFRRAIRRDEISIDPTDNLDLPAIRGRRDRIEPPERAHEYLAALPDSERAFWAVALFCGLRRGELCGLQWTNVDFEAGAIRVERSWDPRAGRGGLLPHGEHRHRPADEALPPRPDRPAPCWHPRADTQRRQAAVAVLAHPTRDGGCADARAAGDLEKARVAADRTTKRRRPRA